MTKRSGLIPMYRNDNGDIEICLMVPSDPKYGGDMPQIAKGIIEDDMAPLENALKEGQEELGYIHKEHYRPFNLGEFNGIIFYAVRVDDKITEPFHYETGAIFWMTFEEALSCMKEWQKEVIRFLVRMENGTIEEQENTEGMD